MDSSISEFGHIHRCKLGFQSKINKKKKANSVDPDETARYEPSHLDLHCLQGYLYWSVGRKRLISGQRRTCFAVSIMSPRLNFLTVRRFVKHSASCCFRRTNTLSEEVTLSKWFASLLKVSTLKGMNLLRRGANSFLLESTAFQRGFRSQKNKKEVYYAVDLGQK